MPSKSKSQQRLFQAAEHGADFPKAKKIRNSMSHDQMHDFAAGSEAGKPEHVGPVLLHGTSNSVIDSNRRALKQSGKSEVEALHGAMAHARKGHPHKNLGKYLHPSKTQNLDSDGDMD